MRSVGRRVRHRNEVRVESEGSERLFQCSDRYLSALTSSSVL